ncbi:sugar transferase [Spongisporangium articulatum]|uniref:Sugar transferase n=1 Tax=Spongisporangium articulatum TaxID=3362603 RepID=A0ABW8AJY5_9ACTN
MTLRDQTGRRDLGIPGSGSGEDRTVIDVRTAPTIPAGLDLSHILRVDPAEHTPRRLEDDDPPTGSWTGPLVRLGVRPLLFLLDLVACTAGAFASGGPRAIMGLFTIMLVALFAVGGLYRSRLAPSVLDDLPQIAGRLLVALALTMTLQLTLNRLRWDEQLVDWKLLIAAGVTGLTSICLRAAAYALVRHARRTGRIAHRTLILGAGRVGTYLAESLSTHPEYGLQPIGFLDIEPPRDAASPSHRILGRPEQLVEVLLDHRVRNVVVAFGSMRESEMVGIIRTCDRLHCEIFVVPRLFELHHVGHDMDTAWGMPLVRLRRAVYRSRAWQVKRALDIFVSGCALLLLSPLMLLVAFLVRMEGGPGVLFRQERVGVDGRHFELMKFRSLKPVDETESQTNWNIAHDDRLGPVGKFLRRSSIDELPQLLNILRGDMSLVGPRPERPHFVATFRSQHPHYVARHRVPCGLTGLAQVNGLRGDTSIAERARFDNYYIENWSLWLDIKIILRTAMSVIRAEGA